MANKNKITVAERGFSAAFCKALEELFDPNMPAEVANHAAKKIGDVIEREMKQNLAPHRLTGETINAVTGTFLARAGSACGKTVYAVGIDRNGNVKNERPHPRIYRRGTLCDKTGMMGEGAFYKGVYLEYGHGTLDPTNWYTKSLGVGKRKVRDVTLQAIEEIKNGEANAE